MFVLLNMTQWNRWVQSGVRAGAELPSPPSAACLFSSTLTKAVWSIPAETSNQEKWFCASVPLCPQILSWLMNLHLGSMKYKPEIGREVLQTWLGAMHLLLTLELAAQEFKQTWAVLSYAGWHCCRDRIRAVWWLVGGKCYPNSAFPASLVFAVGFWWWVHRTGTWGAPCC